MPAFQASLLALEQQALVGEGHGTASRPPLQRLYVRCEFGEDRLLPLRRGSVKDRHQRERIVDTVVDVRDMAARRPKQRLRFGGAFEGRRWIAKQEMPLDLQNPVEADYDGDAPLLQPRLDRRLVKLNRPAVGSAKALDEGLNAAEDIAHMAEPDPLDER